MCFVFSTNQMFHIVFLSKGKHEMFCGFPDYLNYPEFCQSVTGYISTPLWTTQLSVVAACRPKMNISYFFLSFFRPIAGAVVILFLAACRFNANGMWCCNEYKHKATRNGWRYDCKYFALQLNLKAAYSCRMIYRTPMTILEICTTLRGNQAD